MSNEIVLRTPHAGQSKIYRLRQRRNVVRCGRRWGKTIMLAIIACNAAAKGKKVGIFTPESKQWAEIYDEIEETLHKIKKSSDRTKGKFRTKTGGKIDFWSVNDNYLAGRGREYDIVLIDEAAFGKNKQFAEIWTKAISPTMLTTRGVAWVFSTPFGNDPDNFFYSICTDKSLGWTEFYAPTSTNPFVPPDELELERKKNHPLVFQQEFEAKFVDWSGIAFFSVDKLLVDGKPVAYPEKCDGIFAVIDTAVKGGQEHDGTAIIYCAYNKHWGVPVIILDWDVVQIDGAMLEHWMPSVFSRLNELTEQCNPRYGNLGAFIEDAAAGSILLQQGINHGWNVRAIDSKLTSVGKDERAISVSGYFHQEKCKISQFAHDKEVAFKGATKNHLLGQVAQFRIGDKDAHKRADDLLDTFIYAIAIATGDKHGI